jgi:hypothetical protein
MGGGTAGSSSFPNDNTIDTTTGVYSYWIVDVIKEMIDVSIGEVLVEDGPIVGGSPSPLSAETTPSPDEYMGDSGTGSQAKVTLFDTAANAIAETTDYASYIAAALTGANTLNTAPSNIEDDVETIRAADRTDVTSAMTAALTAAGTALTAMKGAVDTVDVTDLTDAYEVNIRKKYLGAISRLASGMADINAVNSSAFIFGMAAIERELLADVAQFASSLAIKVFENDSVMYNAAFTTYMNSFNNAFNNHLNGYVNIKQGRDGVAVASLNNISSLANMKIDAQLKAVTLQHQVNRDTHEAEVQEHQRQLQIDMEDALWDWKLFAFGGNLLAASGGAVAQPPQLSTGEKVFSGVLAAAAVASMFIAPNPASATIAAQQTAKAIS